MRCVPRPLADAELLSLQDKIGTLDTGKLADIVAVPGNPAENIRQTEKGVLCHERRRHLSQRSQHCSPALSGVLARRFFSSYNSLARNELTF